MNTQNPAFALSVQQPWAHAIIYEGKDVENRDWKTNFRGDVYIHASKKPNSFGMPKRDYYMLGGIIGVVTIIDCVMDYNSRWFCGHYGFVLSNPRPTKFVPCRGALGFWRVSPEVLAQLEGQR